MKRFARHFFTLCSAVSLLLCVAVCVLWVQSYSGGHQWCWSRGVRNEPILGAQAVKGSFELSLLHPPYSWREAGFLHGKANKEPWWAGLPWATPGQLNWWGAGFRSEKITWGLDLTIVWMPIYWLAGLTCLLPSLWLFRFLKRCRRRQRGVCTACGYDLRASPERCPECGILNAVGAAKPGM